MVEEFNKDMFQFTSFCTCGEQSTDPTVIGGKASTGGFGGCVKNSESIRFGEVLNHSLIFRNGEIGVTTVSGIDHHFEEFLTNLLIDCFDHFSSFGSVGEILEFHSS